MRILLTPFSIETIGAQGGKHAHSSAFYMVEIITVETWPTVVVTQQDLTVHRKMYYKPKTEFLGFGLHIVFSGDYRSLSNWFNIRTCNRPILYGNDLRRSNVSAPNNYSFTYTFTWENKIIVFLNMKDKAWHCKRLVARLHRKSIPDLGLKPQLKQRSQNHIHLFVVVLVLIFSISFFCLFFFFFLSYLLN